MKEQIIKYIESNKISTAQVADALNGKGAVEKIKPIGKYGKHVVGEIYYVVAYGTTEYHLNQQLTHVPKNSMVLVKHWFTNGAAAMGALAFDYTMNYKKAKGIVVDGNVRDVQKIVSENYPVWAKDVSLVGLKNDYKPITRNVEMEITAHKNMFDGGIAVADDNGAILVSVKDCDDKLLSELERIKKQEKVWNDCLKKGMNTFEIVCEHKYLD